MSMTWAVTEDPWDMPSPIYGGTKVTPTREQNRHSAEDGTGYVYDHETTERFIELSFRCTLAEVLSMKQFFEEETLFSKYSFWMICTDDIDLGAGLYSWIEVRLWQADFPQVYDAPGRFPVKIILRAEPA